jgi:crotonobetainyl-CoA:carnitine CoA-transferase CaiB-like acyl-CoA transferase
VAIGEDTARGRESPVLVRISAYGQDGPLRAQPGFARIAHAFSGLAYLSGEPGRLPVVPGSTSLADYMSGMYGAIGALVALRARDTTGEGQCVDLALYESVFRVLDEIVPAFQQHGLVRERMGADTVNVCPHSHYQTSDGKWIALACSNDRMFERLADAMGRPELASQTRYGDKEARLAARDDVNRIVSDWMSSLDHKTVLSRCAEFDVPASLIFSIADIFEDPQYRARGNIRTLDSRIGDLAVPDVVPRLSGTPGEIRWLGEGLGAQNEAIFQGLLGLDVGELKMLREQGVI